MRYYEGASVSPVDHHSTARGTEWALRSRSVSYEWVPEASKVRGGTIPTIHETVSSMDMWQPLEAI